MTHPLQEAIEAVRACRRESIFVGHEADTLCDEAEKALTLVGAVAARGLCGIQTGNFDDHWPNTQGFIMLGFPSALATEKCRVAIEAMPRVASVPEGPVGPDWDIRAVRESRDRLRELVRRAKPVLLDAGKLKDDLPNNAAAGLFDDIVRELGE